MDVTVDSKLFDCLLTDVSLEDVKSQISTALNQKYLSDVDNQAEINSNTISGIIWGRHRRLFVMAVVSWKGKNKRVHFFVDTGAPFSYLCEDTLKAFQGKPLEAINPNNAMTMEINNRRIQVTMSPPKGHFRDINMLGSDFLGINNAILEANYETNTCVITLH
ncbi:hypothetical protein BG011_001915 [Mortierella polycephala]|uniref:Uncharacterized protein n=1 Tax=Mortierella polycephala TaxID=41804 RepID=A0A9P6PFM4_9FUNG|nr:hypothetical protein BG011_001915 [Mortierella polycephala]